MDPAGRAERAASSPDAEEFVRFCYRRRRVGWPELYDEMCAVATRGSFRGMGRTELAELGIGFSLFETAHLAELVRRVIADEQARRSRPEPADVVRIDDRRAPATRPEPASQASEPADVQPLPRLVTVASGA